MSVISAVPKAIEILERRTDRVRFRIVHDEADTSSFLRIQTEAEFWRINSSEGVVEISNLGPFTLVQITALFCDSPEPTDDDHCGEHMKLELKSNVAGEYEVLRH